MFRIFSVFLSIFHFHIEMHTLTDRTNNCWAESHSKKISFFENCRFLKFKQTEVVEGRKTTPKGKLCC